MSAVTTTTPVWQWPVDVRDFAVRQGVDGYLAPLLSMTHQVYPTARSVRVSLEHDRELRDVSYILFEVEVPRSDIPNYVQAQHAWDEEFIKICPAPLVFNFCLILIRVTP